MSTQAQITANRFNAQKSTGPKSAEGKAASSLNALKSGIDAWSHIIPGEDPAELASLAESYLLHFQPADPNQLALVDTLVSAGWIQRRLRRIEAHLWKREVECLDAGVQSDSSLGHVYQNAIDPLTRIQRRIDATNRMYLRTLKALQNLQAAAAKPASAPAPLVSGLPSPLAAQSLAPQIGFVPNSAHEPWERSHFGHENNQAPPSCVGKPAKSEGLG